MVTANPEAASRSGFSVVMVTWPSCGSPRFIHPRTQVFEACDEGRKGYLSREDFKVAVVTLFGYKPSKLEVDSMLPTLSESRGVRPDEFVELMSMKQGAQLSFGDHRQIFSVFDTHCRGFLNVDDFKRAFQRVAPHLPDHTVLEAFREVDRDSDGLVCYKDFELAMNYGEKEED